MRQALPIVLALFLIGCTKPKPAVPLAIEGEWRVELPAPVEAATEAIWQDTTLRFKPDGSFVEYGGLRLAGRYEVGNGKVHLDFGKVFGTDADFVSAKMAPLKAMGGNSLPLTLDLKITEGGALEAETYPPGSSQSRVVFRKAVPGSLDAELRTFAKMKDDEALEVEGQRIWDDIVSRPEEAKPILLAHLSDEDRDMRTWAVVFLGYTKDKSVVSRLLPMLEDKARGVRNSAVNALAELKATEAVTPILEGLKQKRIDGYSGPHALVEIGDKRAVPGLRQLLKEAKNPKYIIDALGKLGDPAALPDLRQLKANKAPDVTAALCAAIAKLDPQDPYPKAHVPELLQISQTGADFMLKGDAMQALLAIGDPQAKTIFIELVDDRDAFVRRDAIEALGSLRAKDAAPSIRKHLNDDEDYVREAAKKALRLIEG